MADEEKSDQIRYHPNGRQILNGKSLKRPERNDKPFMEDVFPDTTPGNLLRGLVRSYLIKQEPRLGWARKSVCDDRTLLSHPCEMVAAHQWGVMWLLMTITKTLDFKQELPDFDHQRAYEMAAGHDLAELVTGDITPVDGYTPEEKHKLEADAMLSILSFYPPEVRAELSIMYTRYEGRRCNESRFVKDCDRLDFMISAFVYERQGFSGFGEFYTNTLKERFSTKIAKDVADTLVESRNDLAARNLLYRN